MVVSGAGLKKMTHQFMYKASSQSLSQRVTNEWNKGINEVR